MGNPKETLEVGGDVYDDGSKDNTWKNRSHHCTLLKRLVFVFVFAEITPQQAECWNVTTRCLAQRFEAKEKSFDCGAIH